MKLTNIAAASAAVLSTSVLARSTVYVTVVTCDAPVSTSTRSTVYVTINTCAATDDTLPTATATEVSPTDVVVPTGVPTTDVSPTDAAPTATSSADDASPTEAAPTDVSPTDASPTETGPTDVPVPSSNPDGPYTITGNTVNCRSGPGTDFPIKKTFAKGSIVSVTCQTAGTKINGNEIWDLTSDGCFVSDFYVKTGSISYVKPKCDASSIPDAPAPPDHGDAGEIKNDYPYGASTCGDVDRWYYYACQCTSFVAWRINDRLGLNFHNKYKGAAWGNAESWDEAARQTGVLVDNKPVPGSIAHTNAGGGGAGHVAWVAAVQGDSVTIEEYNYVNVEGYSTRTVPASTFDYIHL
jgi:surface antigen